MRLIAKLISWIALLGVIVPPCLYLAGSMDLPVVKTWMLVSSLVWFVTVPIWMDRKQPG
jgi:hypothetical protein